MKYKLNHESVAAMRRIAARRSIDGAYVVESGEFLLICDDDEYGLQLADEFEKELASGLEPEEGERK
jgi:hypothetical protein